MNEKNLRARLSEALAEIPLIDAHTHLDALHLAARGLHDVLLYHMVISDLVSAGCPERARLSEDPSDAEAYARLAAALPYVEHIQNTAIFWGVRIILRDLYEWTEPITTANWRALDERIREMAHDPAWAREILHRANIRRACTELWRGRDGLADDVLQYALEWAFFTRAQWGINDIALYELERTWDQPVPEPPLPVTLGERAPAARPVQTVADVQAAIMHYVDTIPYDRVLSTAQHLSTDIHYRLVSDDEMAQALAQREAATTVERDIYASYILEHFLTALTEHSDELVYQFSIGAEPLPFETGSKLRQETIFELAAIIARHPKVHFQAFLSNAATNQALCTLTRELPNLSLAGYWWHNFFPSTMRQVMSERLDMVATNKQIGFFSDAYCVDWSYAKAVLVRTQLAEVLAQKVEQGQYTMEQAIEIAGRILFESPQTLLGLTPGW